MSERAFTPDASIAVKLFLKETGSSRVEALFASRRIVIAPEMIAIEVASAIARRFRLGEATRAQAEAALERATDFFTSGGLSLTPDIALLRHAETIALDIKHPLVDCLYIAQAEIADADLITADAALISRAAPHFPFVQSL